jgi:hypothetical protein
MFVRRLLLCLPALCLGGCSWIPYAVRNTSSAFTDVVYEYRFQCDIAKLAEEAWTEIGCGPEAAGRGGEFEVGFKAGFTDYLDANGTGQPPAMPPRHLTAIIFRTEKQNQDIRDWFDGFRLGAATAAQSRWRDRIVIPLALPPRTSDSGYRQEIVPPPGVSPRNPGMPGLATFETADEGNKDDDDDELDY